MLVRIQEADQPFPLSIEEIQESKQLVSYKDKYLNNEQVLERS